MHSISATMKTKHHRRGYRYYDPMSGKRLDWDELRAQEPISDATF
jgi:hypothetical protein